MAAEFINPSKEHTIGFRRGYSIPKSVKCAHSATKVWGLRFGVWGLWVMGGWGGLEGSGLEA